MYTIENVHSDKIECCRFSRNGKQIISVGRDHLIKITDFSTYKEIATIEHQDLMIPAVSTVASLPLAEGSHAHPTTGEVCSPA